MNPRDVQEGICESNTLVCRMRRGMPLPGDRVICRQMAAWCTSVFRATSATRIEVAAIMANVAYCLAAQGDLAPVEHALAVMADEDSDWLDDHADLYGAILTACVTEGPAEASVEMAERLALLTPHGTARWEGLANAAYLAVGTLTHDGDWQGVTRVMGTFHRIPPGDHTPAIRRAWAFALRLWVRAALEAERWGDLWRALRRFSHLERRLRDTPVREAMVESIAEAIRRLCRSRESVPRGVRRLFDSLMRIVITFRDDRHTALAFASAAVAMVRPLLTLKDGSRLLFALKTLCSVLRRFSGDDELAASAALALSDGIVIRRSELRRKDGASRERTDRVLFALKEALTVARRHCPQNRDLAIVRGRFATTLDGLSISQIVPRALLLKAG